MTYEQAIERVNELTADDVEYNTTHRDAGDAYAHMPRECWCSAHNKRLADQIKEAGIDTDMPIDEIADLALENFQMQAGHIFTPSGVIVLDSYPVGEVETDLSDFFRELQSDVRDAIIDGNDTDAFVTGTHCAYTSTDAVWYAVISPDALRDLIRDSD